MTIKATFAALLVLLLPGCAGITTASFGAGQITNHGAGHYHDEIGCNFNLRHTNPAGFYVEFDHTSMCFHGDPFDKKPEAHTDTIRVGKTFILRDSSK